MKNGWIINYTKWAACYFHEGSEVSLCGESRRNHGFVYRITELEEEPRIDLCPVCEKALAVHLKERSRDTLIPIA
jgi:hypothetical protein